jgi:hypothetical protein
MPYINRRDGRDVETVDSFDTWREANAMAREYRTAEPGAGYYTSARACKAWRDAERQAARPETLAPARPLLAYVDSFAGLVPCRVTLAKTGNGALWFDVTYTGRGERWPTPYRAGQTDKQPGFRVVPRSAVTGQRSRRGPRIAPGAWAAVWPELLTMRGANL